MTALQTPQEFISAVRQYRLVDPVRLKAFAHGLASLTAHRLADRAVRDGLLTPFQAGEVLGGRADHLILGDYRLITRLGEGGAGGVFLAEHMPTGERRAVKVLHGDLADDPVAHDRLGHEATAIARLCHPNLVRVFEYQPGWMDRPPFLAMEYVDGVSLQAAVALGGTFTAEAVAECGRQVALALQHAWDAGLVHRDVKPANLLLARDGQVKLLDFGTARLTGMATMSNGRKLLGTAEYIAPEQVLDGSAVDCRADVYALGGTLYFLLAGHPPFHHTSWSDRLRGKGGAEPPPIHHLRPDVPRQLSAVITATLARRPGARPATPAALARQLARWADPAFAGDLFARLDRAHTDTLPEGLPVTPGPIHPIARAVEPESGEVRGSTAELPSLGPRPSPLPEETVRVHQPRILRPTPVPRQNLWWLLAAAVFGLVLGLITLVLSAVR